MQYQGLIYTIIAVSLAIIGCSDRPGASSSKEAYAKGVKEATDAIAKGKLLLKEYPPLPSPPGHSEYVQLLRDNGVDYIAPKLPAGVSQEDFIQEVRGWNSKMEAEIKRKLDKDIFTKLRAQAQKKWKEAIQVPPKNGK